MISPNLLHGHYLDVLCLFSVMLACWPFPELKDYEKLATYGARRLLRWVMFLNICIYTYTPWKSTTIKKLVVPSGWWSIYNDTPPKTNIAPEESWLEDYSAFEMAPLQRTCDMFGAATLPWKHGGSQEVKPTINRIVPWNCWWSKPLLKQWTRLRRKSMKHIDIINSRLQLRVS